MTSHKFRIVLLTLLITVVAFVLPAQAQSSVDIVVTGAPTDALAIDDTFSLTVEVQAGTNEINGAEIHFTFDPAVLQVNSITKGSGLPNDFFNSFNNTNGTIDYAAILLNIPQTPEPDTVSGTFTLLTINFQAVGNGETTLGQGTLPSKATTPAGDNILNVAGVAFPEEPITVGDEVVINPGDILYRVNAGGLPVTATDGDMDWSADTNTNNSQYLSNAGSNNIDDWPVTPGVTVPAYVPPAIFSTERWDNSTDPAGEMQWEFPVPSGDYVVNLYMGNGWGGTNDPGERVFDVAVEDNVPAVFDDIDLSAEFGHQVGGLKTTTVTVTDGNLTLDFIHGSANNPTVNGIEIIAVDDTVNNPPTVDAIDDQTVVEGNTLDVTVNYDDLDGEDVTLTAAMTDKDGADVDIAQYSINDQNDGTAQFQFTANVGDAAGSPYDVTITADDQTDSVDETFVITVSPEVVENVAPVVSNPGTQTNFEGDVVSLQVQATAPEQGQTLTYVATNLPPGLSIDANTGLISGTIEEGTPGSADGAFIEQNGQVVIEMESADSLPGNWETIDTYSTTFSPNVNDPTGATGGDFIIWQGSQFLSNQNNGVITYQVQINNTGTYQFKWRNQVGNGTETTEHNDTWLKIEADSFYGLQSGTNFVCPKGYNPQENDCTGDVPDGSGGNGFFKVYSSGANNWSWVANTSDNDAHQIYARFDEPGVYNIIIAARSSSHAIDRMVLNMQSMSGNNGQGTGIPESPRVNGETGTDGAAADSPYNVTVSVTDNGDPTLTTDVNFTWNVNEVTNDNPAAFVSVTPGSGLGSSTYGNGSFTIQNTGDVNITNVTIDASTGWLPDAVFDPVGTAGDQAAQCLNSSSGASATGITVPANGGSDAADCESVFAQPHNGVDNDEGYDVLTLDFTDFEPNESFVFGVDMDPTSIKGDLTAGDSGSISGFELIGATVTITFENGTVLAASLFDEGSLGGSEAVIAPGAPTPAPTLEMIGLNLPTTSVQNQSVLVTGPANADVTLLQVDAHLYIDPGNPSVGYDIDPFEANSAMAKVLYTATLDANGTATIPVSLLLTAGSGNAPDGGLNHFIAVVEGSDEQNSLTSNTLVVEYDPNANPALVIEPTTFSFVVEPGATASQTYTIDTSDDSVLDAPGAAMSILDANDQPVDWASTTSAANQGVPYDLTIDATNLTTGTYTARLIAGPVNGYENAEALITLNVTGDQILSALVQVNAGATDSNLTTSTFGNSSFQITNTGEGDIVRVSINTSTAFLPDIVFDPVGTAGDSGAQCLVTNNSQAVGTPGQIVPGDPCVDPFSQPHNGVDNAEGYDVITINFNDFNTGEKFVFGVDIDPTSIKGDSNSGDAGAVSGFELIGGTVEIEFADGTILTANLFSNNSTGTTAGGSEAVVSQVAPAPVPTIAMQGVTAPTVVANPNQTILITGGPANATVELIRADARLYVDDPDPQTGTGYDIDPFEANQVINREVITVTLDANGNASIPVTLTRTAPNVGPEGGLNHFIASVVGAAGEATLTTNSFVVEFDPNAGIPGALVEITPGQGLGASTFGGSSAFQITNQSTDGVQITEVSIDLGTGILPDMVFDPTGSGGDATAQCFNANSGAATTTGLVPFSNNCVDPFSVPRQGGFDVLTAAFTQFDPTETFTFSTDIDPNSIQGVAGAGFAGAVSGYELIGSTITVTFSNGVVLTGNLYEDGSLGGSQIVLTPDAPTAPSISVPSGSPAIVNDLSQTVTVTGTPGDNVSLLLMDTRLFIESGDPPFNVTAEELPFYANEAMNGKTLYTAVIEGDGTVDIPITMLQTAGGSGPDGGLNYIVAVSSGDSAYAIDQPTSATSNVLVLKYEEATGNTATLVGNFNIAQHTTHSIDMTVTMYDESGTTQVAQYNVASTGDANGGQFTLEDLTPGTYQIVVKGSNTLQTVETVTLVEGTNTYDLGALIAGDANNDNEVTLTDFSLLVGTFNLTPNVNGYNGAADFNGDGAVSILDFSILADNFNAQGEEVSQN